MQTQVEDYLHVLPELAPLYLAHWEELALDKDRAPLSPRWDVYEHLARTGQLLVVTLRDHGRLVGYFIGFVQPALHYSTTLELTTDIWRVLPDVRGRFGGVRLFRAVKRAAVALGCHRMSVGTKLHKDADVLLRYLGLKPVETYYSAWIAA